MRRFVSVLLVIVALVLVFVFRFARGVPRSIELIDVPQGLSTFDFAGVGHVFVRRDGLIIYAWRDRLRSGRAVVWCPREQAFWAPSTLAVYDPFGNIEREGNSARDTMVGLRTRIDPELRLFVSAAAPTSSPSRQHVAAAVMEFYGRYLSQSDIPAAAQGHTLKWCPNPVE